MHTAPEDFRSLPKIDAHVHVHAAQTLHLEQAAEDNFRLVTINTDVPFFPPVAEQERLALLHEQRFPGRIAHLATFGVEDWEKPGWTEKTIGQLEKSLAQGAIGVKTWKNLGMALRDRDDNFVMLDHPQLAPVFRFLAERGVPVLSHAGEPRNCWLPLEQMTVSGDRNYFREHPEYHMHLHPEYPSYEEQIRVRDRVLEQHPDLKLIGAHLASLEWSVDELARRLDQYPNLAVDMAERIYHFQHQAVTEWQKVRDFFLRYQDRILYATDVITDDEKDPESWKQHIHDLWIEDWQFLTTDLLMTNEAVTGVFRGLNLPQEVIEKVYRQNALRWYPGLFNE